MARKFSVGRLLLGAIGLATVAVLGTFSYVTYQAGKSIFQLIAENRELRTAIGNLQQEDQIGYAKVLSQEERDGQLFTRILFVETARNDKSVRVLEKEYEIEGDVVFFDALIVKFSDEIVAGGEEKALYLWRRVYGEDQAPSEGYPIEEPGDIPARYADLTAKLSLDDRKLFWDEIWNLADDPARLAEAGITAIYGNAVYRRLQPGLIYVFKIDATGAFYPEVVPDL